MRPSREPRRTGPRSGARRLRCVQFTLRMTPEVRELLVQLNKRFNLAINTMIETAIVAFWSRR